MNPTVYPGSQLYETMNRFFPCFWTVPAAASLFHSAVYHVSCKDLAEFDMASEVRPRGARAIYSLSVASQDRMEELMEKNSSGTITTAEKAELDNLGMIGLTLSLENARQLKEMPSAA